MINRFSRTELLFGADGMNNLNNARVAIFGVGGVGGYALEALIRSGVGKIDLIDNDTVALSNLNRQIIATEDTVGRDKVDVAKERALSINPEAEIRTFKLFYLPETADKFDFSEYDYVIDAIDTVKGKVELIANAQKANVPIISSMGAGNKVDPTAFKVADIYATSVDPLAKTMRAELKKRGVRKCKVVYSTESPIIPQTDEDSEKKGTAGRIAPGSNAFAPSVAGLIIASEVIKDIANVEFKRKGQP